MKTKIINRTKSFDFDSYYLYVSDLVENNLCSGEITELHVKETRINTQRIKRIYKQLQVLPALENLIKGVNCNWKWLVLSESWCGDGSQNLPIIAKLAAISNKIKLEILLRDENPEIMNAHLTNGSKAIPKLICINANNDLELGVWGPRPFLIQEKVTKIKSENPNISTEEFAKNLHLWYAQDKGLSLKNELIDLISSWKKSCE